MRPTPVPCAWLDDTFEIPGSRSQMYRTVREFEFLKRSFASYIIQEFEFEILVRMLYNVHDSGCRLFFMIT
jgi:hypothetical protein